jgi:hypothetical protein
MNFSATGFRWTFTLIERLREDQETNSPALILTFSLQEKEQFWAATGWRGWAADF